MPEVDQDCIPGFDIMLKKPIMVKQDDDVTIAATIKGPSVLPGTNASSTVTLEGVTVTFECLCNRRDTRLVINSRK